MECAAFDSRKEIDGGWISPQAHGQQKNPYLFVDSHARVISWRLLMRDPRLTPQAGGDWAGPDWVDFP